MWHRGSETKITTYGLNLPLLTCKPFCHLSSTPPSMPSFPTALNAPELICTPSKVHHEIWAIILQDKASCSFLTLCFSPAPRLGFHGEDLCQHPYKCILSRHSQVSADSWKSQHIIRIGVGGVGAGCVVCTLRSLRAITKVVLLLHFLCCF